MNHEVYPTRAGIAGGILCSVAVNIPTTDLLKTVVLAAIGAVVSVVVSVIAKYLLKKWWR